MSKASQGLRLAPARPAADALALGDMKIDDIVSGLSDEQKPQLLAALGGNLNAEVPAGEDDDEGDDKEKAEDKPVDEPNAEASADYLRGRADESARVKTVFASEHVKGREARAAKMLTTSMSADEIVSLLSDEPKGEASTDAADSKAMLEAMTQGGNADLGTGDQGKSRVTEDNHGWGKARASLDKRLGRN